MPTYTVHEPPPRNDEAVSSPERFVFVRDGFYFWAFVLPPLWLLLRRQWVALVIYFVIGAALGIVFAFVGLASTAQVLTHLLIALLVGLEAGTIQRWTLEQRGWKTLGFTVGEDAESAERRFYAAWTKRTAKPPAPGLTPPFTPPVPQYGVAVRRGPPSGRDVIGLFPEPGGQR